MNGYDKLHAAKIIREVLADGAYTGWTGALDSQKNDCLFCVAVMKRYPDDWRLVSRIIEAEILRQSTRCHITTLHSLFQQRCLHRIPAPSYRAPEMRKLALEWFTELADKLEHEGTQNEKI